MTSGTVEIVRSATSNQSRAEAIRRIAAALPRVVDAPDDLDARGDLLLGAHLAGAVLACVSMGLHHRACHVLGGTYGVGHAEVHAVLLPHVVALQATREPDAIAKLAASPGSTTTAG